MAFIEGTGSEVAPSDCNLQLGQKVRTRVQHTCLRPTFCRQTACSLRKVTTTEALPAGRTWRELVTAPACQSGGARIHDFARRIGDATRHREGPAGYWPTGLALSESAVFQTLHICLARASELRFDHSVAIEWYEQALNNYETIDEGAGVSDCCAMIGYLRFGHGDLDGAYSFFDRGLQQDETDEDELRMASGYRRVGVVQEQRKELTEALTLYERASKIEEENEDYFALSRSLHHQARLKMRQGENDEAEELLKKSMEIKEQRQDEVGLATAHHELGNIYLTKGEMEAAKTEYAKALAYEEQFRDFQGIAVTRAQLGLVEQKLFNFSEAVEHFSASKELFKRLQSPNVAPIEAALSSCADMVDIMTLKDRQMKGRNYVEELVAVPG